jgi:hypothetical protein
MSHLNVAHSLLQLLLSRPFILKEEFSALLEPFHLEVRQFILDSQPLLQPLGLELRQAISDYTDAEYYGICPIHEDPNASECLGLKADVVQLFFKFIDCIINGDDKAVSTVPVGVLLDKVEGLSNSQAQEGIEKLRDLGFLEIRGDNIRIGPRGLLEFRPTFTSLGANESGALQQCPICLDFVLAGLKCPQCECYCHRRCTQSLTGVCPICRCTDQFVEFGY